MLICTYIISLYRSYSALSSIVVQVLDKVLWFEDKEKDKNLWSEDKDLCSKDKDLWFENKEKDKDLWSEDKDKDL